MLEKQNNLEIRENYFGTKKKEYKQRICKFTSLSREINYDFLRCNIIGLLICWCLVLENNFTG